MIQRDLDQESVCVRERELKRKHSIPSFFDLLL